MSIFHGLQALGSLEANLSFGFRNSLVNTFLQVFNNVLLDVDVLTVAQSSQDLPQDALYK